MNNKSGDLNGEGYFNKSVTFKSKIFPFIPSTGIRFVDLLTYNVANTRFSIDNIGG